MSARALVGVYMLITYGIFGVFADIALTVHIAFIFAGLVLLGATLTLPGIAGIVLTIGMAVDSNVLIYERIREEAHMGARSCRRSTPASSAPLRRSSTPTSPCSSPPRSSIFSAPVRCAASPYRSALGILTTIVTAVTMTRMMITLWYR